MADSLCLRAHTALAALRPDDEGVWSRLVVPPSRSPASARVALGRRSGAGVRPRLLPRVPWVPSGSWKWSSSAYTNPLGLGWPVVKAPDAFRFWPTPHSAHIQMYRFSGALLLGALVLSACDSIGPEDSPVTATAPVLAAPSFSASPAALDAHVVGVVEDGPGKCPPKPIKITFAPTPAAGARSPAALSGRAVAVVGRTLPGGRSTDVVGVYGFLGERSSSKEVRAGEVAPTNGDAVPPDDSLDSGGPCCLC